MNKAVKTVRYICTAIVHKTLAPPVLSAAPLGPDCTFSKPLLH
jgi:hypothetical protein